MEIRNDRVILCLQQTRRVNIGSASPTFAEKMVDFEIADSESLVASMEEEAGLAFKED